MARAMVEIGSSGQANAESMHFAAIKKETKTEIQKVAARSASWEQRKKRGNFVAHYKGVII